MKPEDIRVALNLTDHVKQCDETSCDTMCPFYYYSRTMDNNPQEFVTIVAEVDNSGPYEYNQAAIIRTRTGYSLVWISGCSCWDGEGTTYIGANTQDVLDNIKGDRDMHRKLADKLRQVKYHEKRE